MVFVDQGAGFWLRPLKRGYRHCFVALRQEPGLWLICDPLKDRIEIAAVEIDHDIALAEAYLGAGHRIWSGFSLPRPTPARATMPGPLTCVAVVKRLIGLDAAWVLTPFQLHRCLLTVADGSSFQPANRNKYLTSG